MDLHERLTSGRPRSVGAHEHDPFSELKNRIHLALISDLGVPIDRISAVATSVGVCQTPCSASMGESLFGTSSAGPLGLSEVALKRS